MRSLGIPCAVSLLAVLFAAQSSFADAILRDRITLDATDPAAVKVGHSLDWTADVQGTPRTELTFHLARGVDVTAVRSEGAALTVTSAEVSGTSLLAWTVQLPVPIPQGDSRGLEIDTEIRDAGVAGIHLSADGGALLPGSGWYPAVRAEGDELLAHATSFQLPEGFQGVAAGTPATGGLSGTEVAGRPFAAWGKWTRSEFSAGGVDFVAYRTGGKTGAPARMESVASIIEALQLPLGEAEGRGPWILADVGNQMLGGGQRALLLDEAHWLNGQPLRTRDLAGAVAASFWTESMRFSGPYASLFSRALPMFLGDVAAIALDRSDERWRTEAKLAGARRAAFLADRPKDRKLEGLIPAADGAKHVLETRGALVWHMTADAVASLTHFISFLGDFREGFHGSNVDAEVFGNEVGRKFPNQHDFIAPFLDGTDLPDFAISSHGESEKDQARDRYRVEVENRGAVAASIEVGTFTKDDKLIRTFRLMVEPGQKRAVLFRDRGRVARVALDPRKLVLQSDVSGESIDVSAGRTLDDTPFIPAFRFSRGEHEFRHVTGLDIPLTGARIENFTGHVQWYETHHGPSGLLMFGEGRVVIEPPAPQADSFRQQMGRAALSFDSPQMWVRFPVSTWQTIGPVIEAADTPEEQPKDHIARFMYSHSFPTYYHEDQLAQVPPDGGELIILSLGGTERRGWVRVPNADGTVFSRLWDQLRGETLWEDQR